MNEAVHLILLTNFFPYGRGEEYVEAELPYLSEQFRKITIIPTMAEDSDTASRVVPPNCAVLVPSGPRTRTEKITAVTKALLRRDVSPLLTHLNSTGRPCRLSQWSYELYFEARCQDIARKVLAHGMDVQGSIVWYSYWFYVTARVASILRERTRPGTPLVSRGHGYDVNEAASPLGYLPQRELLLNEVDRLWLVSRTKANEYRRRYPTHAHKIATARLGSPSFTQGGPIALQESRVVVSVSAIRPLKRIELIIDAVALLRRRGLDVTWVHFGSGAPDYVRKVAQRAADRIGPGAFSFQGHVPNRDLHAWYAANPASVFVNVSTSEGVPVSIMEAMSYGLPVVATDVGGSAELLDGLSSHGSSVLPVDIDAEVLAGALSDVLLCPKAEYRRLSRRAYTSWERNWSAEVNYSRVARELRDIALAQFKQHG